MGMRVSISYTGCNSPLTLFSKNPNADIIIIKNVPSYSLLLLEDLKLADKKAKYCEDEQTKAHPNYDRIIYLRYFRDHLANMSHFTEEETEGE